MVLFLLRRKDGVHVIVVDVSVHGMLVGHAIVANFGALPRNGPVFGLLLLLICRVHFLQPVQLIIWSVALANICHVYATRTTPSR